MNNLQQMQAHQPQANITHPSIMGRILNYCPPATLQRVAVCSKAFSTLVQHELEHRCFTLLQQSLQQPNPCWPSVPSLVHAGYVGRNTQQTLFRMQQINKYPWFSFNLLIKENDFTRFLRQLIRFSYRTLDHHAAQGYYRQDASLGVRYTGSMTWRHIQRPFASGLGWRQSFFLTSQNLRPSGMVLEEIGTFVEDRLCGFGITWSYCDARLTVGYFESGVCQTEKYHFTQPIRHMRLNAR